MYEYIQEVKELYQKIGGEEYALGLIRRFNNVVTMLNNNMKFSHLLQEIGALGCISDCIYFFMALISESISLDPKIALVIILTSMAMVILSCLPASKVEKYKTDILEMKQKYKIVSMYEELSNGNSEKLNYLYSKCLNL